MNTIRETLLQAVESKLESISGYSDRVHQTLITALTKQEHPCFVVEPVVDVPTRGATDKTDWTFTFKVSVLVRAETPRTVADDLVRQMHAKIIELQAHASVVDLIPGMTEWEFSKADLPLGIVSAQYICAYQSLENNLSST